MGQRERDTKEASLRRLQQRLHDVSRDRQKESSRQAKSAECGFLGVENEQAHVRCDEQALGSLRARCVRSSMESSAPKVSMSTEVESGSTRARCSTIPVPPRNESGMGVPASTQGVDNEISQLHSGHSQYGSGGDLTDGAKYGSSKSSEYGHGLASVDAVLRNLVDGADILLGTRREGGVPGLEGGTAMVDKEDLVQSDWRTFVRRRLEARGASKEMAQAVDLVFNLDKNYRRGAHLDRSYARCLRYVREYVGESGSRLPMVITDVILGNVAAASTSQTDAEQLLSGCRVIFRRAYGGSVKALEYDKDVADMVKAVGKQLKVKQPKYTEAVDLQKTLQAVAAERERGKKMTATTPGKARALRNTALFLLRLHSLARTDDMCKFNAFMKEGMQVYNGQDGTVIEREVRSQELAECVRTEGYITIRFYRPKGSEFAVKNWSTEVEVHTVRPRVVIDAGSVGTWLDDQTAANLCAVRALRDYFCCIEDQGLIPKVAATTEGGFWSAVKPDDLGGKLKPLESTTLRNLVMKFAEKGGLQVTKNETGGNEEKKGKLSAHFLRGHAGSLAHTLHVQLGGVVVGGASS